MSPRKLDPRVRAQLLEIGARLLAEGGPQAITARRIAEEAGSSTMPVYSHFGGMSGLVREIVYEGFTRMEQIFGLVRQSHDPVADMALLGRAYRRNALANPHLYAAMFGSSSMAGLELTEEDRQYGRYTFTGVVECASRCIAAGRFQESDEALVAHRMWSATHGLVTLELGGYLIPPYDAGLCFEDQLVSLMVGAGDTRADAGRSVELSKLRQVHELDPQIEIPPQPASALRAVTSSSANGRGAATHADDRRRIS